MAWRPAARGGPGPPEFLATYHEAIETRERRIQPALPLAGSLLQGEPAITRSSPIRPSVIGRRGSIASRILRRSQHRPVRPPGENPAGDSPLAQPLGRQPRTADYGMQVFSRVLSHAVDPLGKIAATPAKASSSSTAAIAPKSSGPTPISRGSSRPARAEIAYAVDLAAHTGLRLGDLLRLSWSHVGDDAIVITTGKSSTGARRSSRFTTICGSVLAAIPKRSTTILTNSRQRPGRRTASAPPSTRRRSLPVCRWRPALPRFARHRRDPFYVAGLSERVIAEIMGWEEEHVAKIIRRYVGPQRGDEGHHPPTQRKENINCKTGSKTALPEGLSMERAMGIEPTTFSLGS